MFNCGCDYTPHIVNPIIIIINIHPMFPDGFRLFTFHILVSSDSHDSRRCKPACSRARCSEKNIQNVIDDLE